MMNYDYKPVKGPEMKIAFGSRFIHLKTGSIVEVVRELNNIVAVKCVKCPVSEGSCDWENSYGLEYFDRVFNPIVDVELPDAKD